MLNSLAAAINRGVLILPFSNFIVNRQWSMMGFRMGGLNQRNFEVVVNVRIHFICTFITIDSPFILILFQILLSVLFLLR